MDQPLRPAIEPFVWILEKIVWHGEGHGEGHCEGKVFKTDGAFCVSDPCEAQ
jgi:hypothetical protein